MTVAVAVKVWDGVVLAADSATTARLSTGSHHVYDNAVKVFQLHRKYPVAAVTWGLGSIGSASIATLAKDLRSRFMGQDPAHANWTLDDSYTVQSVAERLRDHMFDELWEPEFRGDGGQTLGFLIAGYSANSDQSEAWDLLLEDPSMRPDPNPVAPPNTSGWLAYAQPEAVHRLFTGFNQEVRDELLKLADPAKVSEMTDLLNDQMRQVVPPFMPLGNAIELANFMVSLTCSYSHVTLGPDTVGGPIEVAAISKHEGFKWISRKHYYKAELNPEVS